MSSRVTWIAGAMMCEGASPRSWMTYSPRSVSTALMPFSLERRVEADLLGDHRLALGHHLGAARLADAEDDRDRFVGVARVMHVAARLDDLALVGFEIEIEMGERVVLDRAGAVAQRVEFRQPRRGVGAPADEVPRVRQRALQALVVERVVDIVLEARRGGGDAHFACASAGSPIAGSSVMPASTSATWRAFTAPALTLQLARHVHQAAEIAGEQGVGAGRDDLVALARDDRVGQFAVFDREGSAEAAADVGLVELDQAEAFDAGEQLARLVMHAELAQARAGIVIGGDAGKARRDAGHAELVDQEARQLAAFGREGGGLDRHVRLVGEQFRVVFGEHAGAGAARRDDVVAAGEGLDRRGGRSPGRRRDRRN